MNGILKTTAPFRVLDAREKRTMARRRSTTIAALTLVMSLVATVVCTWLLSALGLSLLWLTRVDVSISAVALGLVALIYRAEHKIERGENIKLDALIEASDATDELQRIEHQSEKDMERAER